jgi:hypothetical protein
MKRKTIYYDFWEFTGEQNEEAVKWFAEEMDVLNHIPYFYGEAFHYAEMEKIKEAREKFNVTIRI